MTSFSFFERPRPVHCEVFEKSHWWNILLLNTDHDPSFHVRSSSLENIQIHSKWLLISIFVVHLSQNTTASTFQTAKVSSKLRNISTSLIGQEISFNFCKLLLMLSFCVGVWSPVKRERETETLSWNPLILFSLFIFSPEGAHSPLWKWELFFKSSSLMPERAPRNTHDGLTVNSSWQKPSLGIFNLQL